MDMRTRALAAAIVTAAVIGSSSAAAQQDAVEHWEMVAMKGGALGWETESIAEDDDVYTLTRLMYFAAGQPFTNGGGAFTFLMQDISFDCLSDQFQVGDSMIMDADGEIVGNGEPGGEWLDVEEDTVEELLEAVVCYGESIGDIFQYDSSDAAMAGAKQIALPE